MLLYPTTRSEWSMLYGGDGMGGREREGHDSYRFSGPISIYTVSGQRSEEEEEEERKEYEERRHKRKRRKLMSAGCEYIILIRICFY